MQSHQAGGVDALIMGFNREETNKYYVSVPVTLRIRNVHGCQKTKTSSIPGNFNRASHWARVSHVQETEVEHKFPGIA